MLTVQSSSGRLYIVGQELSAAGVELAILDGLVPGHGWERFRPDVSTRGSPLQGGESGKHAPSQYQKPSEFLHLNFPSDHKGD